MVRFYCDIKIKILRGVHSAFNRNESAVGAYDSRAVSPYCFLVCAASFFLSHILIQDNQNASTHQPQFHILRHLVPPCHLDILGLMVTVVHASPCVGLLWLKINYTFWQEDLLFKAMCIQWHWDIFLVWYCKIDDTVTSSLLPGIIFWNNLALKVVLLIVHLFIYLSLVILRWAFPKKQLCFHCLIRIFSYHCLC